MEEHIAITTRVDGGPGLNIEGRIAQSLPLTVAGEPMGLLPQFGLWWPARRTVFIADTHFGKTATFRSHGIPVGDETLEADLDRLSEVFRLTGAERLVILGDLLHARRGRSSETIQRVTDWRRTHSALSIELVSGNHARAAGPPVAEWHMQILADGFREGPFIYRHHPKASADGYVLAGHLHPKVVLQLEAGGKVKLPCFWVREAMMVLPAFSSFIDSAPVQPALGEAVFAVAEGAVHDVTALTLPDKWPFRRNRRRR